MLIEIFKMQAELNARCGFAPPGGILYAGRWINNFVIAAEQELAELRDCTYWKHWYKEAREGRRYELHSPEKAKEEVIDLLHFWVSLAQAVGLTAEEVFETYKRKNAKNHKRQDDDATTIEAKDAKYHINETPPCEQCWEYEVSCHGTERLPGQDCKGFIAIADRDELLINRFLLLQKKLAGNDPDDLVGAAFEKIPDKYKVCICSKCGREAIEACGCGAQIGHKLCFNWEEILNEDE